MKSKKSKKDIASLLNGPLNDRILNKVVPYTRVERVKRFISNSAGFDRASYEADGGDKWIHPGRELFFDRDKAKDKQLWDKVVERVVAAYGSKNWKFIVWLYQKEGGRF